MVSEATPERLQAAHDVAAMEQRIGDLEETVLAYKTDEENWAERFEGDICHGETVGAYAKRLRDRLDVARRRCEAEAAFGNVRIAGFAEKLAEMLRVPPRNA